MVALIEFIEDLALSFLKYDRREDEDLPRGTIENMIAKKELTTTDLANWFKNALDKELEDCK